MVSKECNLRAGVYKVQTFGTLQRCECTERIICFRGREIRNLGITGCRGRESLPLQRWDESCPAQITFILRHNYILPRPHGSYCLVCCQQLKRLKQREQNHKNNWHGITCHRLKTVEAYEFIRGSGHTTKNA